jgi:hypothetical protein
MRSFFKQFDSSPPSSISAHRLEVINTVIKKRAAACLMVDAFDHRIPKKTWMQHTETSL